MRSVSGGCRTVIVARFKLLSNLAHSFNQFHSMRRDS